MITEVVVGSIEIHELIDIEEEESDETELEFDDEDIMELKLEFYEEAEDDDDDEDDVEESEKVEKTTWNDLKSGKTVQGVEVMKMKTEISHKYARREVDACEICYQVWTAEGNHRMSCLPCGHIFGMSCILDWLRKFTHAHCLRCNTFFALKDVRMLYVNRLSIPAADDQKEHTRSFPYSKQGYTAFKQYIRGRLTHALNKRSDALKQRANVLGRQNAAMGWRTNLLNRQKYAERRAKALEQRANATGRADALRRAGALRLRADALGQRADERLQKADEFGRQAKALLRQAKAFRRQFDACKASLMFFKQSYKELHGFA